ncbi:MAG: metallophosphoesterase family protein [Chloroflexota bacterium]|nr:metallophosphoesterase family protein [Chloroflexota bacterium]
MKIGIISDTHDNLDNLEAALEILAAEGVTHILHCGDVCGADVVQRLAGFEVWIAQGNMDRSIGLPWVVEETLGRGRLAWLHKLTLDGYSVGMIHGDNEEVLGNLVASGEHAYVFHGHTHRRRDQKIGCTRAINPGALGGTRKQNRSFCILDLATGEARLVELETKT